MMATVAATRPTLPTRPGETSKDRMNPRHWSLLVPLALVFGLCYVLPLANVIRLSLVDESGFTTQYYTDILSDPFVIDVLLRTLKVAGLTTLISIVLGFPLGLLLAQSRGLARSVLTYAIIAPLLLSGVVRSFGWFILLRNGGIISDLLAPLGVGSNNGLLFSETAIVIGLVHLYMPMLAVAVSASAQQVDLELLRGGRSLGARPSIVLARILVPLTVPGLLSGSLLVFSLSSSAFATPAILGGTNVPVASYLIYQQGLILGQWAAAGALSVLLLTLVATVSVISLRVGRRYGRRGQ